MQILLEMQNINKKTISLLNKLEESTEKLNKLVGNNDIVDGINPKNSEKRRDEYKPGNYPNKDTNKLNR